MRKILLELIHCALAQGYGLDLRPLYDYPVVDLVLYSKLLEIVKEEAGL